MSERILTRSEVAKALEAWQRGEMSSQQIHDWANDLYLRDDIEYEDWENDESVTNEVIGVLDMLDLNLALPEDAPMYNDFLKTPKGEFAKGYLVYQNRLDAINYKARAFRLKNDPLYASLLKYLEA